MTGIGNVFAAIRNGGVLELGKVPRLELEVFQEAVIQGVEDGLRVASFFALAAEGRKGADLIAVLADDGKGELLAGAASVSGSSFPSLTPDCPQVHLFEREIAEQFGLRPEGHPWLKPVRFSKPLQATPEGGGLFGGEEPAIGVTGFYRIEGREAHEVAVGPVHAGIIEPGHFRFQCHGEQVFHLEISLGYQHRGIEEALLGGPHRITPHQMATAAGDSSIAHGWAYYQNLEALGGARVPARAHFLRAIALELERLANHTGDLGALAADVGYLPTSSYCGRIRGDFLNMTAALCGNRFGRGFLCGGGTRFDLDPQQVEDLLRRLEAAEKDVSRAVQLLWTTPSVMARFENIGAVSREACLELGLVGPAARACGIERDARNDHPTGAYQFFSIPVATAPGGDVLSRALVRWIEIQRTVEFIRERLSSLPGGDRPGKLGPLAPGRLAVSLIEGWRGEVCHVAVTGSDGRFARYKITDPSFHNWMGLAVALRQQQISDFPLCNKSFNLSYCGFDL